MRVRVDRLVQIGATSSTSLSRECDGSLINCLALLREDGGRPVGWVAGRHQGLNTHTKTQPNVAVCCCAGLNLPSQCDTLMCV